MTQVRLIKSTGRGVAPPLCVLYRGSHIPQFLLKPGDLCRLELFSRLTLSASSRGLRRHPVYRHFCFGPEDTVPTAAFLEASLV